MNNNKINMLEKDEYGLYINSINYQECRNSVISFEIMYYKQKLNKIPRWIRWIFNALQNENRRRKVKTVAPIKKTQSF